MEDVEETLKETKQDAANLQTKLGETQREKDLAQEVERVVRDQCKSVEETLQRAQQKRRHQRIFHLCPGLVLTSANTRTPLRRRCENKKMIPPALQKEKDFGLGPRNVFSC